MIILFFIFVVFLLFGIMLSLGKWAFLISGYNMMSEEEKKKYNEKAMCKFMGKVAFSIAFCIILSMLSLYTNEKVLRDVAFIAIFLICIFAIIYLNVAKKFKN